MSTTSTLDAAQPSTSVAGKPRGLTFRPPQLRDPRLHVAAVLLTVQVLGQTVIDWDLSVAQILDSARTERAGSSVGRILRHRR